MNHHARTRLWASLSLSCLATGLGGAALAAPPAVRPVAPAAASAPAADDDAPDEEAPTVQELTYKIQALETRLDQMQALVTARRPGISLGGYVDFGFFIPQGNGSGIVRDEGNANFPQYAGRYGWVFLGDLLAPTVNSRGEAADLGEATGVQRFDSIHSGGAPGFIVNEVNLNMKLSLGDELVGTASVNFVPRSGQDFALGDFIDVDIAQMEWIPSWLGRTSIFVGKFDSVLGIEYRERKSNQRFGITPSLMGRYTMGTALGLKLRSKFGPNDEVVIAAALTNGSFTTEQFHFYDEIDRNAGKTASGRLSARTPRIPGFDLELGVSGSYGAQDRATNVQEPMWFVGVDLLGRFGPVDLKAQWLKGKADGWPGESVYGLNLHNGGYLELDWMATPVFGFLARGEFRDAFVWRGDPSTNVVADTGYNRAYVTKVWRATGGVRVVFSQHVVLKAEYLRNGEYGGLPKIRDDVFTSSLVFMN